MPKGKGTYGKQVGRPPEDGSKRSVKTYAGGGLTGYNVPQPQGSYPVGGKKKKITSTIVNYQFKNSVRGLW